MELGADILPACADQHLSFKVDNSDTNSGKGKIIVQHFLEGRGVYDAGELDFFNNLRGVFSFLNIFSRHRHILLYAEATLASLLQVSSPTSRILCKNPHLHTLLKAEGQLNLKYEG